GHHLAEDGLRGIEDVRLILREIAELDVVADPALAGGERLDAGEQLDERGLAGAVRPDERDALAALEREVEPIVDDELAVALAGLAELEDRPAAARRGREADVELLRPRRDFQPLDLLELLDATLDELRLRRLVAELTDEALHPLDLFLLHLVGVPRLLEAPLLLLLVPREVARVVREPPVFDFADARHRDVEEVA